MPEYNQLLEDLTYVRLAQRGDDSAFTALFNRYCSMLGAYLLGLVKNVEDRDDLLQETFLKAWRELPRLRDPSLFKPWLFTIATNLVRDRKRRKEFEHTELEESDLYVSSEKFEEAVEEQELIKLALEQVPFKHRICLLLENAGRLSLEEIAEVLGVEKKSVYTYLSRAKRDFRKAYYALASEHQQEYSKKSGRSI